MAGDEAGADRQPIFTFDEAYLMYFTLYVGQGLPPEKIDPLTLGDIEELRFTPAPDTLRSSPYPESDWGDGSIDCYEEELEHYLNDRFNHAVYSDTKEKGPAAPFDSLRFLRLLNPQYVFIKNNLGKPLAISRWVRELPLDDDQKCYLFVTLIRRLMHEHPNGIDYDWGGEQVLRSSLRALLHEAVSLELDEETKLENLLALKDAAGRLPVFYGKPNSYLY
jgi:hypothetical protein